MRIVGVDTILLTGPVTDDPWLSKFRKLRSASFIEIRTDAGHVGVGETYAGYFFPESVPLVVDYLKPILLNATDIDFADIDVAALGRRMRLCCAYWGRVGLGAAVISGIEAALWDLKGKLLGVPAYELIGGRHHDELPVYATGGPSPWPHSQLERKADFYLGLGFRAFKVSSGYLDEESRREVYEGLPPHATAEVEASKVAALRDRFGPDAGILLDGHMGHREGPGRWDLATAAAVLDALEPYDVVMFEEPLPYGDVDGYGELTQGSAIRVAGGEQLSTVEEFKAFADRRAFAVCQPDAAWVGMGTVPEIAAQFPYMAPHAWGAGAAVMQNIHAAFACPNAVIVELPPAAGPLHREIWGDSLRFRDGVVLPPEEPGLGVQLTDAVREKFPFVAGTGEFSSVPGKRMEG